jgi:hypothetical protein
MLKKAGTIAAVTVGLMMFGSTASAEPAEVAGGAGPVDLAKGNPRGDFVVGGGISDVDTLFGFAAFSSATGDNPSGYATFRNREGVRAGKVTCLRVAGNAAVFGIADEANNGNVVYRQFFVRDNGAPSGGGSGDELREVRWGMQVEEPCADPAQQSPGGLILQAGDIVVRDAT